jgi:hypothetical protein
VKSVASHASLSSCRERGNACSQGIANRPGSGFHSTFTTLVEVTTNRVWAFNVEVRLLVAVEVDVPKKISGLRIMVISWAMQVCQADRAAGDGRP